MCALEPGGGAAAVGFQAWVLVPLQGAAAGFRYQTFSVRFGAAAGGAGCCKMRTLEDGSWGPCRSLGACALEPRCWCNFRVPLQGFGVPPCWCCCTRAFVQNIFCAFWGLVLYSAACYIITGNVHLLPHEMGRRVSQLEKRHGWQYCIGGIIIPFVTSYLASIFFNRVAWAPFRWSIRAVPKRIGWALFGRQTRLIFFNLNLQ